MWKAGGDCTGWADWMTGIVITSYSIHYTKLYEAAKTGPSTQTRFMSTPSGVCSATMHPAQPPTPQAMPDTESTFTVSAPPEARDSSRVPAGASPTNTERRTARIFANRNNFV